MTFHRRGQPKFDDLQAAAHLRAFLQPGVVAKARPKAPSHQQPPVPATSVAAASVARPSSAPPPSKGRWPTAPSVPSAVPQPTAPSAPSAVPQPTAPSAPSAVPQPTAPAAAVPEPGVVLLCAYPNCLFMACDQYCCGACANKHESRSSKGAKHHAACKAKGDARYPPPGSKVRRVVQGISVLQVYPASLVVGACF